MSTTVISAGLEASSRADAPASPAGATRTALRDIAPCALAVIPFGLAVGSASAAAGLSGAQTVFGAVIMLAGSGQLAAVQAMGRGEGIVVVALVVALVNMRFVFYGAAVARWFSSASRTQRLMIVYPIVDQVFMLCQQRFETVADLAWRKRYYLVATAVLGSTFVASQAVSYHVGAALPPEAGLHLAAPLVFTGMLAGATRSGRQALAAVVAAVAATLGAGALGPLALPLAVAAGIAVATRKGVAR